MSIMDLDVLPATMPNILIQENLGDNWDISDFPELRADFSLPMSLELVFRPAPVSATNIPEGPATTATRGGAPFHPESTRDWEAKKEIMRRLYLVENLPLKEITHIMAKDHSFSATERMYKRQFLKWNWRKYNTKGLQRSYCNGDSVERAHGRTTCKRPARRNFSNPLARNNRGRYTISSWEQKSYHIPALSGMLSDGTHDDQRTYRLLASLRDLIYGTSRCDPDWCDDARFDLLPSGGTTFANYMTLASELFAARDFLRGGAILRKGFREVEEIVKYEAIEIFQSLLLDGPYFFPKSSECDSQRLLQVYLQHVSRLLQIEKPKQPITETAMLMYQISRIADDAGSLFDNLEKAHRVAADCYIEIRGMIDLNSLERKLEAISISSDDDDDKRRAHGPLHDALEELLRMAISQFGPTSKEAIRVGQRQISAVWCLNPGWEGRVDLGERHFARLHEANGYAPLSNWPTWYLETYGWAKYYMHHMFASSDDTELAILSFKEAIRGAELSERNAQSDDEKTEYACRATKRCLELIGYLYSISRDEEAEEIRAGMTTSKHLDEIVGNDLMENSVQA